ncbi:pentapeptide repeat-containing protein [Peristeroidobacter agariperforans]|uniref:pentapeptide repeat-containing protein n=1 Tax=Peristeroidobacter agariperforans TaxID=268404 RepID=UPI0018E57482|nr:pentapeptide repeat-containing protein [Peristeroidobacter agariperforans]
MNLWQCRAVVARLGLAYLLCASSSFAAPATREQVISQLESGTTDLSNLQANGVDLSGIDFRGARLFGANLDGANLANAKLARCNLDLTLMRGTVLVKADLREASIFGVSCWIRRICPVRICAAHA